MSNGLTPMGSKADNQELLESAFKQMKIKREEMRTENEFCFGVYTMNTKWMYQGYINMSSAIYFNSEHDAIEYLDKWIASGKGFAKLISPKY